MNFMTETGDFAEVCVRSAARAVVARHYGMPAFWRPVWREEGTDVGWHSSIVLGPSKLSPIALKRVSLAAIVAEQFAEGANVCPYAIDDCIWAYLLTAQEEVWLGDYRFRDITDTIRLISRNWNLIQFEVEAASVLYGVSA